MIYSCFNDALRRYEVFEDDLGRPMNADLPTPTLPPMIAGVGVPAIDAGRKLPPNARRVGDSWHARGVVVRCDNASVGSFGGFDQNLTPWVIAAVGVSLVAVIWWVKR